VREHTSWDTCRVWECEKCEQEGANWVKENGLLTLCGDCLRPDCYHLEQVRGRI
jgi:hypothetical protein